MKSRKNLMKYLIITAAVLIIFAVIGKRAGWFGKELEISVATEKAENRTIVETITANGKVRPQTEVKISPDVSGEIVELHVVEGDQVERGQLLLKIKPDTYISMRDRAIASVNSARANLANANARLAQVEAQYEQAERNYNRSKRLFDQQTISEAEYETSRSSYNVAKAEVEAARQNAHAAGYSIKSAIASLEEAEENLNRTIIFSPMSGTVSRLNVEQGERVVGTAQMAGTEMMRIANLNRMEVLVAVNENDIVRVKHLDTAIIEIDAYMGQEFRGVVTEIANSASNTNAGTDQITNFDVKVLILQETYNHLMPETPAGRFPFLPGMSATTAIQTNTKTNVLTVPIQAVTTRPDSLLKTDSKELTASLENTTPGRAPGNLREVVFVVDGDNNLQIRQVSTGIQDNNYIEIIGGLEAGDEVVIAPYSAITRTLNEDSSVKVVDRSELFN
jgi:HlyD family secretion protein